MFTVTFHSSSLALSRSAKARERRTPVPHRRLKCPRRMAALLLLRTNAVENCRKRILRGCPLSRLVASYNTRRSSHVLPQWAIEPFFISFPNYWTFFFLFRWLSEKKFCYSHLRKEEIPKSRCGSSYKSL